MVETEEYAVYNVGGALDRNARIIRRYLSKSRSTSLSVIIRQNPQNPKISKSIGVLSIAIACAFVRARNALYGALE